MKSKIPADTLAEITTKITETLSWLDNNQLGEKEEFEEKQKDLEKIVNPVLQAAGGGAGGAGGVPAGFPGAGAGAPPASSADGPQIEEVD